MKEILYYDEESINSILSQFGGGIIQKLQVEDSALDSETETAVDDVKTDSGLSMNLKLSSGSLPGGEVNLGGKFGGIDGVSFSSSRTLSEGQKDIIEKIFHDHALELLIKSLDEKYDLSTNSFNTKEGDFTILNGNYIFYDFEIFKRSLNQELLIEVMSMAEDAPTEQERKTIIKFMENASKKKQLNNEEKRKVQEYQEKYEQILALEEIEKAFKMLDTFSRYSNEVLNGLVIFKIDNQLVIAEKKKMRIASEALSFRADSSVRKIKVLGRVIGKKGANTKLQDLLKNFMTQDLDKIPAVLLDVLLSSFEISAVDDIIINPIAIYYEET